MARLQLLDFLNYGNQELYLTPMNPEPAPGLVASPKRTSWATKPPGRVISSVPQFPELSTRQLGPLAANLRANFGIIFNVPA